MAKKSLRDQRVGLLLGLLAGAILLFPALIELAEAQSDRNFFDNLFGTYPASRPAAPAERAVDYTRAPAPKKAETAPTSTVLVLGDSMADWLAYGLEDALSDTPELGVIRKDRTTSGLVRYDSRNEAQDWAGVAREAIAADKPSFIVMMLGLNDRQTIRERAPAVPAKGAAEKPAAAAPKPEGEADQPDGGDNQEPAAIAVPEPPVRGRVAGVNEFRSERWAAIYTKRIDDTIAVLKSRSVPVYWVGLPAVRGTKSTADMVYLNELFRARAEKAGINYIDVWDGFVDEQGRFTMQGPDVEGQIRRLRTGDGVHFTKFGARKLAHFVEREIRRALDRGPVPVALPSSEPQAPATASKTGGGTARPLAGPVMPLTATTNASASLLGGPDTPPAPDHVTATRVLIKGDAVAPPAGRSDDFAWPRRGPAPFGTDPVVATTTLPLPVMQPPPSQTTVVAPSVSAPAVPGVTPGPRVARQQPKEREAPPQRQSFPFPFFSLFR